MDSTRPGHFEAALKVVFLWLHNFFFFHKLYLENSCGLAFVSNGCVLEKTIFLFLLLLLLKWFYSLKIIPLLIIFAFS